MDEQAVVEHFALVAKARLMDLLKLKVRHIYETTPGTADSKLVADGCEVDLKLYRTVQPYKDIERFLAEDKLIGFIVNPGLLSIVKAIAVDVRGRQLLVTRKIGARANDKGVFADMDHFGIRINMYFDSDMEETKIVWECLYGVG